MSFTHLHLHTVNSRLDGAIEIEKLMEHCKQNGMTAVAMTDHGNMAGAIEFYTQAKKHGINPIIGQEIYLVEDHTDPTSKRYHEGLLAMDITGYKSLVRLSSDGFTHGLQRNRFATVDDAQIEANNAGLICLSGCVSSRLARTILGGCNERERLQSLARDFKLYAESEDAFQAARRRARDIAIKATTLTRLGQARALSESRELHEFLDSITSAVSTGGRAVESKYSDLIKQSDNIWHESWASAKDIVSRRLDVFGDRYYLETQIIPSSDQLRYNDYVRQLSQLFNVPVVVTADAHYLLQSDADIHRLMLRIGTDTKSTGSEPKEKVAVIVELPDDQRPAVLATAGDTAILENLYDELIADEMACAGKKVNVTTAAYAERRNKWVKTAQLFVLQQTGIQDVDVRAEQNNDVSTSTRRSAAYSQVLDDHTGDIGGIETIRREVQHENKRHLLDDNSSTAGGDSVDAGRKFSDWSPDFWVRTPEEMVKAGAIPEEMENTVVLASRCNLELEINDGNTRIVHMPVYNVPPPSEGAEVLDADGYLAHLCQEGLQVYLESQDYKIDPTPYFSRLCYELGVIREAGFANYFLVVWDYIEFARSSGGLTGPGRGSAAASLVTFCIGITKGIDPLKYPDLMFERFLTPGRPDLPDIDTDFDVNTAKLVYNYCQATYGENAVAKIGTFSTLGVRSALMDVGRILGIDIEDVRLASKILSEFRPDESDDVQDNKAQFSLIQVCQHVSALEALRTKSAAHIEWFSSSDLMQGKKRNAGIHASGIAIGSKDLQELGVPFMASTDTKGSRNVMTQFGMDDLAKLGVPKFDQLKLDTLNILSDTERLIGRDFDIQSVRLDDNATWAALAKGDNLGVFQVAQPKVRGVLKAVRPRNISDIAAVITIIRPGLFARDSDTGLTQEELYKARRQGSLPVLYKFPFLEPILRDTQGVMIYQEQILKVCWAAGMDPLEADGLRKVLSKKIMSKAKEYRDKFIPGAQRNLGLSEQESIELWDLIVEFAAYGFNAAHAYAYGLIGYWTSYLKTHYGPQFMAATITTLAEKNSAAAAELLPKLLEDCNELGRRIPILPPDVNESSETFTVEPIETRSGVTYGIRFGLYAIPYVSNNAAAIIEARRAGGKFSSIQDFDDRVSAVLGKKISKTALSSLVQAGALDSLASHRSECQHLVELRRSPTIKERKALEAAGWTPGGIAELAESQAALCMGYHFVRENLEVLGRDVDDFFTHVSGDRITIGGRVVSAKLDQKSRKGTPYHSVALRTSTGEVKVQFYGRGDGSNLDLVRKRLMDGAIVLVEGQVKDDKMMWGSAVKLPSKEYRKDA